MIEVLHIIVTPLREYFEISVDQLDAFDIRDERPSFANYRKLIWYLEYTPELLFQIEKSARMQGIPLRIERRGVPRFHETRWARSNSIEECK